MAGMRSRSLAAGAVAFLAASVLAPIVEAGPAWAEAPIGTMTKYTHASINGPSGIALGPDGALWFTNRTGNSIGRITTAGLVTNFAAASINSPLAITAGPDAAMWFSNANSSSIGRISLTGAVTNYVSTDLAHPFFGIGGIAKGPDGNLWFTDASVGVLSPWIGRLNPSTGATKAFDLPAGSGKPQGITAGPDGAMWFTYENGAIGRITTAGAITPHPDARIASSASIAPGADGALWFDSHLNGGGQIGRITTGGAFTFFANSNIYNASSVARGPDGAVWFPDAGLQSAGVLPAPTRISTTGVTKRYPNGAKLGYTSGVYGIADGGDGGMWFTEPTDNAIVRVETGVYRITTTSPLPSASVGKPYFTTLAAAYGTAPYHWKKLAKLPAGLRLQGRTGVISGTPKFPGTFSFTIRVADSKRPRPKRVTSKTFTITIA